MDRLIRKFKNATLKKKIIMIAVSALVFCLCFSIGGADTETSPETEKTTVNEISPEVRTTETIEITEPAFDAKRFVGKTVGEFKKAADEEKCSYSLLNCLTKEDFSEKYGKLSDGEKAKWIVDSAETDVTVENFYKVYVAYSGDVKVPDVKGKNLSDALNILHSKEFSNIEYVSNDNKVIFLESNWEVVSQSISAGSTAKANDRIVLTCKKSATGYTTEAADDSDGTEKTAEKKARTGIDPDFKAFWDSYEAFVDKYVKFMKDPDSMNDTVEYLSLVSQYADFCAKADAYDEDDLTNEEIAYMTKVEARVAAKLADAALD